MPKLISRDGPEASSFVWREDGFTHIADDEAPGGELGQVIISLSRFQADGDRWLAEGRSVGVRLKPEDPVEGLAYDLPRLAVVALEFPKFRDGRALSAAALLRERYGYAGELRAVGEVVRDLAKEMSRCGFDSFEPSDGSTPEQWTISVFRFRHVYQSAADRRAPAFRERIHIPTAEG
ncbi:DUF934 domain-containing protein [Caulobacter sp. S45]|uniref:DUF934 domain-containing protein n=1 Tax=Caulobacter sp. S45 TaxID=1641861 RepID=UPI001576C339|nr:DUF934 domain-containing protein [Caulobacter sp. S45]